MSIVEFSIHIDKPILQVALYDRIQVWRSATELGEYTDITSNEPTPATMDGTVPGPWNIDGLSLSIILNNADPKIISFSGNEPIPLVTTLTQINLIIPGLASEIPVDTGKLRLTSSITGTQSVIQISGDAAPALGLTTAHINGKAARPLLSANTEIYLFRDYDGDSTFWYKNRNYNSITGAVSDFSAPRLAGPGSALNGSLVVTGKVALADLSGKPVVGRRVIFVTTGPQVINDGSGNNYGVLPSVDRVVVTTDLNGRASALLVKGQRLKVFLEGTTFQREFIVPSTDFDILEVATVQPDPLDIVTLPPFSIRVS